MARSSSKTLALRRASQIPRFPDIFPAATAMALTTSPFTRGRSTPAVAWWRHGRPVYPERRNSTGNQSFRERRTTMRLTCYACGSDCNGYRLGAVIHRSKVFPPLSLICTVRSSRLLLQGFAKRISPSRKRNSSPGKPNRPASSPASPAQNSVRHRR